MANLTFRTAIRGTPEVAGQGLVTVDQRLAVVIGVVVVTDDRGNRV